MTNLSRFADFKIGVKSDSFTGDKIKISRILNKEIQVLKYKIVASKYEGQRLDLQIVIDTKMHVAWSGSVYLIDMIKQVPGDGFPFTTTIIEKDEHYEFT